MDTSNTPIKFDIYVGNELVRTEILAEATIKIGKLSSSHVRLDDESVSRMHAVVESNGPDDVVILDLGSATGTFVNGEKITKHVLRSGDRVRLGNVSLVVTIAGQAVALDPSVSKGGRPLVELPLFDEEENTGRGRSLEVLTLWGPTVVDVRHFPKAGKFSVGEGAGASQYIESRFLPQDPYPLAETDGHEMIVNVPDGVEGEVMLDGEVFGLEELKAAGKMTRSVAPKSQAMRLPPRARCRLRFGDLTVLVNSVPAPAALETGGLLQRLDLSMLGYLASAFLLHALFFVIVKSIPEDADRLTMDGFSMSDRFVEFILKPEDELPEKKLTDLFGDLKEEAESEAAEKAKGDEGKMGSRNSDEVNRRFAVKGPASNEEIIVAKERAKTEALNAAQSAFNGMEGELSAVWGTGDRAVGSDAVNALGVMFGDQVGDSQGMGGMGLAGGGRGGGGFGDSSIGVGNVGTKGRGGQGGQGTRYGEGASRLGEREVKVPKILPGTPIISGALDKETVRRIIRQHQNEYRYCYEKQLNAKRDLNGKIVVQFTIAGNGSVIQAAVLESTMGDSAVESCLTGKIQRWVFPAPKGGGTVIVKYPFVFKPS